MSKEKTKLVLNQLVADLSQQAAIIHQVHWYMRGRGFLTLHPTMDKLMDEINAQLDEVSERLITIGGAPYSTLREFADNTKIQDIPASYERSIDEWVRHLLVGYEYLRGLYQEGLEIAGEEGDDVSQDICIGFKGDIEKIIWMLRAHLNEAPGI
ncbi:DNA starvation/stationary phase protection protein [uncultured Granulicatella sp.]|uniref:Dps family protein n=1 Tax=uncultured Granulicatella sp. TaxID=316089 RepID=UPI0028D5E0AA|nr:DNA starvation/stationary phase protection protein [uncultured Granulicatella sp.]